MLPSAVQANESAPICVLIGKLVAPARPRSTVARYGLASILPFIALVVTRYLFHLQRTPYFSLFMALLIVSALYGGKGPGIVAYGSSFDPWIHRVTSCLDNPPL